MTTRLSVATACIGLVVATLAVSVTRSGISIAEASQPHPEAEAGTSEPQARMQNMMKMHEQMVAEMRAADAKLDALVKDMNAATGGAQVAAMTAVVNELVRQHKAMHGRMGHMHQQMMSGHGGMAPPVTGGARLPEHQGH